MAKKAFLPLQAFSVTGAVTGGEGAAAGGDLLPTGADAWAAEVVGWTPAGAETVAEAEAGAEAEGPAVVVAPVAGLPTVVGTATGAVAGPPGVTDTQMG